MSGCAKIAAFPIHPHDESTRCKTPHHCNHKSHKKMDAHHCQMSQICGIDAIVSTAILGINARCGRLWPKNANPCVSYKHHHKPQRDKPKSNGLKTHTGKR